MKLSSQILTGFLVGTAAGVLARLADVAWLSRVLLAIEPLGTVFIRLISMVMVPLVVASLFVGIASLGDVRRLGRIGGKTLAYFVGTTFIAAVIGLSVALVASVGHRASAASLGIAPPGGEASSTPGFLQMLVEMVPQNPINAAAQGDLLPLIIAVVLFSAAATVTAGEGKRTLVSFFEGLNAVSMTLIQWLMRLAPFAVFALVAATVVKFGVAMLGILLTFALVAVVAMAVHVATTYVLVIRLGARLGVWSFFSRIQDAIVMAFSTASSNATLPVSMAVARNRLGVSNEITSFVLPAGATINKNGSAVYKAATAVFLAQVYGIPFGPTQAITVIIAATAAAFAGAGVPGSSLVTTLIVLNAIGLGPNAAAGIALVAAVDRPLDMCRSAVNTIGNLAGAAWIARSEGETLKAS